MGERWVASRQWRGDGDVAIAILRASGGETQDEIAIFSPLFFRDRVCIGLVRMCLGPSPLPSELAFVPSVFILYL